MAKESALVNICEDMSDPKLGWQLRRIKEARFGSVELNDGVSFESPCFKGARTGDVWLVKHEEGQGCFGAIKEAHYIGRA